MDNYDIVLGSIDSREYKTIKIAIPKPETKIGTESIERFRKYFGVNYSDKINENNILLINSFLSKSGKSLKKIRKHKGLKIYMSVDEKTDRWVFEKINIDFIFGMELIHPRDHLHYKRSGLNQVSCKLLKEKNISVLFPFYLMSHRKILGRMIQNIKFCNKYKIDIAFPSFAFNKYEIKSINDVNSLCNILNVKRTKKYLFNEVYEKCL